MEINKRYIMWSDGLATGMGELVIASTDGSYKVKNPVTVIFSVFQEDLTPNETEPEKKQYQSKLNCEITPYVFGVALKKGENVWSIRPKHVLYSEELEFDERLIRTYEASVTAAAKKI